MKRLSEYGVLFAFLFCTASVFGGTEDGTTDVFDSPRSAELWFQMVGKETCPIVAGSGFVQTERQPEKKSIGVGILLSTIVPGTGEFYAGSWLKGALFLGAEIGLWIGYWKFSDNGHDWETVFHEFADTHWDEARWRTWMGNNSDFPDTTHTLPSTKTQQYYEMIGKYDQFKAGWDDYVEEGNALTPNRDHYEGLRHKSNVQFKRASACAMVVMANHLLSALDTAWTIRRTNRRVEGGMRMGLRKVREELVPVLAVQVKW